MWRPGAGSWVASLGNEESYECLLKDAVEHEAMTVIALESNILFQWKIIWMSQVMYGNARSDMHGNIISGSVSS